MNEYQEAYRQTRHITPTALLTMARLRLALAAGAVLEDQVQSALAAGAAGVGELLETIEATGDTRELVESMDDRFDPFGVLV